MNGCECKEQRTAEEVKAKNKAAIPGLTDLLKILGALGPDARVLDPTIDTVELKDFINNGEEFPEGISYVVLEREDFEKLWERSRSIVRSEIKAKHFAPKVPAYSEQEALHTVFSAARKAKMDAFIAQHGNNAFNTYDAWQKLGFQVRAGETGFSAGTNLIPTVRIFHIGQTVAKVPSVRISDVTYHITKFCQANNMWGVAAFKEAYPWTEKYFHVRPFHVEIRETGEII